MSRALKTQKCVICGKSAELWHGYVVAKEKMALGNYIDKKIIAGFCKEHGEIEVDTLQCCYGEYNNRTMGKCIALFG